MRARRGCNMPALSVRAACLEYTRSILNGKEANRPSCAFAALMSPSRLLGSAISRRNLTPQRPPQASADRLVSSETDCRQERNWKRRTPFADREPARETLRAHDYVLQCGPARPFDR